MFNNNRVISGVRITVSGVENIYKTFKISASMTLLFRALTNGEKGNKRILKKEGRKVGVFKCLKHSH